MQSSRDSVFVSSPFAENFASRCCHCQNNHRETPLRHQHSKSNLNIAFSVVTERPYNESLRSLSTLQNIYIRKLGKNMAFLQYACVSALRNCSCTSLFSDNKDKKACVRLDDDLLNVGINSSSFQMRVRIQETRTEAKFSVAFFGFSTSLALEETLG